MNTPFEKKLLALLKTYTAQNADTSDCILAHYLMHCLEAWNEAIAQRDKWQACDPELPTALEASQADITTD